MKEKIYKLSLLISKSELVSKGGSALVFKIGGMLTIYLFHFLLAKKIGAEANGIFSTFFTLLSIFGVFTVLGMDTYLLKKVAQFNSKRQWEELKITYKKVLTLVLFLSVLIAGILYLLFTFGVLASYKQNSLIPYIILVLLPFSVLHINAESFRAVKNIKLFSFFKNFSIYGLAVIVLFFVNNTSASLGVDAFIISVIILAVLSFILWIKDLDKKKSVLQEKIVLSTIIKESFPMFLSGSLFLLMSWVDILMLGYFNEQTDVGVYTIALKLASVCTIILFAANTILGPKISELHHNNQMQELAKTVQNTAQFTFLLSIPIFGIILLFPESLLAFFGSEFKEFPLAIETLIILSIGQMINVFFGAVIYILDMTGKQNVSKNILLFTAFVNIAFNWYLIPIYGIKGAAIATTISIFCWTILGAVSVKKHLNFYAFPIFKN